MEVSLEKTSFSRESRALNPEHIAKLDAMRATQMRLLHSGEYKASHAAKTEREAAEASMQQARVDRELSRQAKERSRLEKGWLRESERFDAEWAARTAQLEAENAERIRVLEEVQHYAREELETSIEKRHAASHYRMSKGLLEYSLTEKQLALGERFDEAIAVKKRTDVLRRREERAHEKELHAKFDAERERLQAAQKAEMDNLVQKCHALKVSHMRARAKALAVLKQKYKNLDKDMAHAFTMEFKAPPACEVLPTAVSRADHGSTFRGTIKIESLAGSKGAIPNLSELPPAPIEDTEPELAPWLIGSSTRVLNTETL